VPERAKKLEAKDAEHVRIRDFRREEICGSRAPKKPVVFRKRLRKASEEGTFDGVHMISFKFSGNTICPQERNLGKKTGGGERWTEKKV